MDLKQLNGEQRQETLFGDSMNMPQTVDHKPIVVPVGYSGYEGWRYHTDDYRTELSGIEGLRLLEEMASDDMIIASGLQAIESLMRPAVRTLEPAEHAQGNRALELVEMCMENLATPWSEFIGQVLSCLIFGHSVFAPVWAECNEKDVRYKWVEFQPRPQLTLRYWSMDGAGQVQGWYQDASILWQYSGGFLSSGGFLWGTNWDNRGVALTGPEKDDMLNDYNAAAKDNLKQYGWFWLPREQMLMFRRAARDGNPMGSSLIRPCYAGWRNMRELERIEGIALERFGGGLPVIKAPLDFWEKNHPLLKVLYEIVRNVRMDESAGVVMPSDVNEDGKPLLDFELQSTASRAADISAPINRYAKRILMTMMADVMMVGHESVGTQSLAETKDQLLLRSIDQYLTIISHEFNTRAIPQLLAMNNVDIAAAPKLTLTAPRTQSAKDLAQMLQALAQADFMLADDPAVEAFIREAADLPEMSDEYEAERAAHKAAQQQQMFDTNTSVES